MTALQHLQSVADVRRIAVYVLHLAEHGPVDLAAGVHDALHRERPLARRTILCLRRTGMSKQCIAQLQSTGYGDHHVGTLECLGLVDKETIRNLTRTFGDADKVLDVSCCACFPKGCVLG